MIEAKDRIVVALDVESGAVALDLVDRLRGHVGMFKVGKQLFTAEGPSLVREIISRGERVFLDLKYHDIPATVTKACIEAARLGVSIVNLHASGGSVMMREAVAGVTDFCQKNGLARPLLLAVTVLTSLDDALLAETGIGEGAAAHVARLARLAHTQGIDGVVASPLEIELIRREVAAPDFVILTPGIRPAGEAKGDQRRVMTPADAIAAGADYIVIGRPITGAADPAAAAMAIGQEVAGSR